jgi:urease accessory protein UreE
MKRARDIKAAGHWDEAKAVDAVALDAHDRHRRRVMLSGERGTKFLLDLPQATALRDGDGLVLDDGAIVRVIGRPEPLIEIAAANATIWHASPGISAIVTSTCKSSASGCASGAITLSKICCAGSAHG